MRYHMLIGARVRARRCAFAHGKRVCGVFQQPFAESEMRDTFRELAQAVFTPESVTHVEQVVDRCEQLATVRELTALLRRCGRS